MNAKQLWQQLAAEGVTQGSEPEHNEQTSELWYVRVLQGFAGWLAALLALGFLGFGVAGLFDYGWVLLVLGLIMNAVAYGYYQIDSDSDFMEQVMLAISLCGQFLFVAGLFVTLDIDLWRHEYRHWLILIAVYQSVLVLLMQHFLHRLLSAWFAMMALFWAFDFWVATGLGTALTGAVLVWLWLDKVGWGSKYGIYEPVAYALVLALIQFSVHGMSKWMLWSYRNSEPSWLMLHGDWFAMVLNAGVLFYLIHRLFKEQSVTVADKTGVVLWFGAGLIILASLPVQGLSSALVALLLGVARQNRMLQILGVLALIGFVSWYYYWMEQTLLYKSMLLMGLGLVLLVVALVWRRILQDETAASEPISTKGHLKWVPLAVVLLTMVIMNLQINHKERVLVEGQTVLLDLAPVDPRSIMQGDFMRLRFAMGNDIRTHVYENNSFPYSHSGQVVVSLDTNQVATMQRLHDGETLAENEVLMQYRVRNGRVKLATNAFFFQEGQAKLYDQAHYGVFKVDTDGSLLLYAMADDKHQILGVNRLVE